VHALPVDEDEVRQRMHGPKALTLRNGKRREDGGRMTMRDTVALIPVDGPIYRYADYFTAMSGGITTEALARQLQTAIDDPAVGAILFVIDSPGGEATGINELSEAIYSARSKKPVWAYVEGYGASAAYWIASAAEQVIIDDTALLGSIGTVLGVPDPSKRTRYTIEIVSRQSPKKRPDVTTEAGLAVVQDIADGLTDVFIAKVARNRRLTAEQILAVEGGMLIGEAAVAAGLADMIGSEEGAVQALLSGAITMPNLRAKRTAFSLPSTQGRAQQEVLPMAVDQKGFWAGFFGGAKDAGIITEAETAIGAQAAAPPPQAQQQRAEPDPQVARLQAELTKLRAEQIQKDAAAFAASEMGANRAQPAEKEPIAALYARLAEVDAEHPRQDGQPSCVTLLTAAYTARPAHSLSKSLIQSTPVTGTVLANAGGEEESELAQTRTETETYAARRNGSKK